MQRDAMGSPGPSANAVGTGHWRSTGGRISSWSARKLPWRGATVRPQVHGRASGPVLGVSLSGRTSRGGTALTVKVRFQTDRAVPLGPGVDTRIHLQVSIPRAPQSVHPSGFVPFGCIRNGPSGFPSYPAAALRHPRCGPLVLPAPEQHIRHSGLTHCRRRRGEPPWLLRANRQSVSSREPH